MFAECGPGIRPGDHLLSCARQERRQRRAHSLRPFALRRANLRRVLAGCAMELTARCALRSDNHGESVHEAGVSFGTPATPQAPTQAQPEGVGSPLRPSRCARPRGCRRYAPHKPAERSDGLWAVRSPVPFRMCRGAQRPADQGSRLFERNAVKRVRARPAGREHRRLPAAKRRDTTCRGALSLVTFFRRRERKLLASPGDSRPPPSARHSANYQNNSFQRMLEIPFKIPRRNLALERPRHRRWQVRQRAQQPGQHLCVWPR